MEQHSDRLLSAYDYQLPETQIAQIPVEPRDRARLLVVTDPQTEAHAHFFDLPQWLRSGDLLVMNNTRVIPARLLGYKAGGGAAVEVLLIEPQAEPDRWLALVKPGRRLQPGTKILFGPSASPMLSAEVVARDEATGGRILEFTVGGNQPLEAVLETLGQMPLPPYITQTESPPDRYQTVYAAEPGAVAAPTAGLHFTPDLLDRLAAEGIQRAFVTLHVGIGTFRPVEAEVITDHAMHAEWVEVPQETVDLIEQTRAQGGRVFAVGTTTVRSLEGVTHQLGSLQAFRGKVNVFIYPGFEWRVIDGLITNFHLPKSSLMMLVSSLIGRERLLDLYNIAIAENYRFYSFGDAMLILPEATLK